MKPELPVHVLKNVNDVTMDGTEDDWLFNSIRKYKTLLMFDLHKAATSLTWVSDKSVCVSTQGKDKYEVLELSLPEKILTTTESEGLCSDRDFRVISGGFSGEAVNEIRHIPTTRLVAVTKKESNGLSVWSLGDSNSDLIDECVKIENPRYASQSATLDCSSNQVVFGSRLNDLCLVDTSTSKVTGHSQNFPSDECLSKLFLLDDKVLLACCRKNCELWKLDLREGLNKGECIISRRATTTAEFCGCWSYDIERSAGCIDKLAGVISLESGGQVVKMDLRNAEASMCGVKLAGMTSCDSHDEGCGVLKTSPTHKDIVSVSGLDHSVHVYNLFNVVDGSVIQPDFTHDGHMACSNQSTPVTVTSHIWHPWQPNLILSSASDGSLHAWQREET